MEWIRTRMEWIRTRVFWNLICSPRGKIREQLWEFISERITSLSLKTKKLFFWNLMEIPENPGTNSFHPGTNSFHFGSNSYQMERITSKIKGLYCLSIISKFKMSPWQLWIWIYNTIFWKKEPSNFHKMNIRFFCNAILHCPKLQSQSISRFLEFPSQIKYAKSCFYLLFCIGN